MIDKDILYDLYYKKGKTQYEIAEILNISQQKVSLNFKKYGFKSRNSWSEDDVEYLKKYIGIRSVYSIAKKIGKSPKATLRKAERLGLGATNYLTDEMTARELARAVGTDGKTVVRWINTQGLKANKKKLSLKRAFWRISITDFWEWAEKNRNLINWHKFELNILGKEPKWVEEARKLNLKQPRNHNYKWTKNQDKILTMYWNAGKTTEEIGVIVKKTGNAVSKRAYKIGLKKRKIAIKWKPIEDKILIDLKLKGFTDNEIAEELGRSYGSVKWRKQKMIQEGKLKNIEDRIPAKVNLSSINLNKNSILL